MQNENLDLSLSDFNRSWCVQSLAHKIPTDIRVLRISGRKEFSKLFIFIQIHNTGQLHTVMYSYTQLYTVIHSTGQLHTVMYSYTQLYTVIHSYTQYRPVTYSNVQLYTVIHSNTQLYTIQASYIQ